MTKTANKYPSAFYAAAGVGDLVYEQLRKWQDKAVAFGGEQAPEWKRKVADLSVKVDAQKVRETVVVGTQAAAQKATQVYEILVTRGERAFHAQAAKAEAAPQTAEPKTASHTATPGTGATKAEPAEPKAQQAKAGTRPAKSASVPVAKRQPRKKAAE